MLLVVSLILTPMGQIGTLDEHLAVRDFEGALEMTAGSDSLNAVIFEAAGDNTSAARLFGRAFEKEPSAELFSILWSTLSADADHYPELSAALLRSELSEWGAILEWGPEAVFSLVTTASVLGDTILMDSLSLVLVESYPLSQQTSDLIGWEFWDGLYPAWYDDSARVVFLEEFLADRGEYSDLWRSRTWRYLLSASLGTADSVHWEELLGDWLGSCPQDPQAYLSGAVLYIERDSSWSDALELTDRGLSLMESSSIPVGMPPEEWEITGNALEADLLMRRCQALLLQGDPQASLDEIVEVSGSDLFGVWDHHTRSPYLWLEGVAALAVGDTSRAMDAWIEAVILGDVRNSWADSSMVHLTGLLPDGADVSATGRELTGYTGPVFDDVSTLLGPDSLVVGTRVSWCDWNADGWPDLLLGRDLYRNDSGEGFTLVSEEVFADSNKGNGGIWGDLDRNGWADLVTSGNPVQVFMNEEGSLSDMTEELGLEATGSTVEGVGLFDWNADGWLDIYLASYEATGNRGEGTDDALYFGGPEGFREVSDSLGMEPFLGEARCGRGVSPCDFDRDGDMDIFISNYRLQENFLWENGSSGASNSALSRGCAGHDNEGWWGHTIGSAWGDFNGDGSWDLFSANLAHPRYISFSDRSELLLQNDGEFTDVRPSTGILFEETHSNPLWADFDNDGKLDLYITSIYVGRRSFLYRCIEKDPGTFIDVGFLSGGRVFNGWGAAAADFDLDGRMDLAVGSGSGPVLLRNQTEGGSWLLVKVSPPESVNPSGIGCTVELVQGDDIYLRQVSGGSGTTSQDWGVLHFGLASDEPVDLKLYVPGDPLPVWEASGVEPGSLVTAGP